MPCEQDFLTQRAQHLDRKGFVGDDQVDATLVAQCSADDCLLVERGDDGAIHRFGHARLGDDDPMLQQVQRVIHAVAAKLIGVAHAGT